MPRKSAFFPPNWKRPNATTQLLFEGTFSPKRVTLSNRIDGRYYVLSRGGFLSALRDWLRRLEERSDA
jgi:hypothetical protein